MMWREAFALTVSLGTCVGLLAEGQTIPDAFAPYANVGALTILAVVVTFIVTKMLPSLHQKFVDQSSIHTAAIKDQCQQFTAALREQNVQFTSTLDKMHERADSRAKDSETVIRDLMATCTRGHAIIANLEHDQQKEKRA